MNALELTMLGPGGFRHVHYEDDVSAVAVVGGGMRGSEGDRGEGLRRGRPRRRST